jgi:hypothetical protein
MNLLNKIKFKSSHPKQPFIYAVTAGKYLGELLVYVETEKTDYAFLTLPNMDIRHIPIEKFESGLKDKIVEVVEKLPSFVHKTCIQQYNKNKTTLAFKHTVD